eukprot:10243649-Lingulodinium_polyedra.AAC.1
MAPRGRHRAHATIARQYRTRTFQPCMASDLRARETAVTTRSLAIAATANAEIPPIQEERDHMGD